MQDEADAGGNSLLCRVKLASEGWFIFQDEANAGGTVSDGWYH